MYLTSERLLKRIQDISNEAELASDHALSFEEYTALPFFGQIILRFALNLDEYTLDDLDRYESLLNDIAGEEFMTDFMGVVYKKVGVDFSTLDQRLIEMTPQFSAEEIHDSIHADGVREDAATLLKRAGLDTNIPVWEIQIEEDENSLLLLGKENKLLFTVDAPMRLSVMEVDGNRATGLIKTAFYCKKNGISLARVLLNQL